MLRIVQEKGFLEKVFDALREGVIVTGARGTIHYLNRAACELFGIDRNNSIGHPIENAIRGLDWTAMTRSGRVVSRDLEITYPDPRYVNCYVAPLESDETGTDRREIGGFVLLFSDITETRELQREEIESEKLNALTMLAAGVAHEIGNPLNSLNIHLQLIERKLRKRADPGLAAELGKSIGIARNEIRRLDFIVEKFLTAVRPTEPRFELTDLNSVVRESVEFLAPEIENRQITVELELDFRLPPIKVDRDQMKQAFYNLIRNASQALGSKGALRIRTECDDVNVTVSFADNGEGIAPDKLSKVFEPYFTTKKTGSGLGLLIVRRIVREHGGEIEFESEEGAGTTVSIYLPRTEKRIRLLPDKSQDDPGRKSRDAVIDVEAEET